MVHGPCQDAGHPISEPGEFGFKFMNDLSEEGSLADQLQFSVSGEQPGHHGEGHQQGEQGGYDHRDTKLGNDVRNQSGAHGNRQEHHHDHQGDGSNGEADLFSPVVSSAYLVLAHFHMTVDVLYHHDRVVYQDPHHQRKCQQTHQVQAVAHQVHP